jgi:hypothetical protein
MTENAVLEILKKIQTDLVVVKGQGRLWSELMTKGHDD